jgi:hypothetical protein
MRKKYPPGVRNFSFLGCVLLWACNGQKDVDETGETGPSPEELCEGVGEPGLVIGFGVGEDFRPYEEGSVVGLDVAPQGGFGVPVRARTSGIRTVDGDLPHATSSVLLDTYIDGDLAGSFLNETVEVYCQDDGSGLIWGVVVGFDPETYATNEDLLQLNGQEVMLLVRAIDPEGRIAEGTVDVVISVGR